MLDTVIDSKTAKALAAANRYFGEKPAAKGAIVTQTATTAVHSEDAVTVSLSKAAITASVSQTTVATTVGVESANASS